MTQLVPVAEKLKTVRALLEKSKGQIEVALPKHMSPDRMLRVAMTCIQRNPLLLDCTPTSLIGALIKASQLGLEPDGLGNRAYLIPRRNNKRNGVLEANFQAGYAGLMDLARRSRDLAVFHPPREVYQGDALEYHFGTKPDLRHRTGADSVEDEERITHVYAVAELMNGRTPFEIMTRAQIEAHRKKYSKDKRDENVWATNWPAMARKTLVIRLCKWLPASVELEAALALVERDDAGLPQELGALVDPSEASSSGGDDPPAGGRKLDEAMKKLEAGAAAAGPTDDRESLLALLEAEKHRLALTDGDYFELASKWAGTTLLTHPQIDVGALNVFLTALRAMGPKTERGKAGDSA